MRRCDRAVWPGARRRRVLLVSLAAVLAGGLGGAPFVLAGCGYVAGAVAVAATTSHDGGSGTTTATGTAELPIPLLEPIVGAAIAPNDHVLSLPIVVIDGNPVPVSAVVDVSQTSSLQNEAIAHGIFDPSTQILLPVRTAGPVSILDGSSISVSIQAMTPQGPAPSPRIGFIGAPLSSFGTTPLPLVQLSANPAAYAPGGRPDQKPGGAVAWQTRNPAIAHADGPFALPGKPNPDGLQVLDPLQLPAIGPLWANPNPGCALIHARGSYAAAPAHPDPQPAGCSHGALVYLPQVTSSLIEPAPGAILLGSSPAATTFTAAPFTSGLGIERVEFHLADALVGTATAPPWSVAVVPAIPTATADVGAFAVAFDADGVTRSSIPISVTLVAPLDVSLPIPPPSIVVGGVPVTGSVDVLGGLPPFTLELEVDDEVVETQIGSLHSFVWSFTPEPAPEPRTVRLRLRATDEALQTAETPELLLEVAPPIQVSVSTPARAVVAGSVAYLVVDAVGLPPFTGTLLVDGIPHDTVIGPSPLLLGFATPALPITTEHQLSALVLDSVPQGTTSSALPVTAVGTSAPPFVLLDSPPAGIEVLELAPVTLTAATVGGVGGVPVVRFFANGEQVGSDATPADGFGFVWAANPDVGEPDPPVTLPLVSVDLVAEADDAIGQTGQSQPVGILVERAGIPEIPALGGAALVALGLLMGGVAVYAGRRRSLRARSR
jgi:hypothetical protein